MRLSALLFDQVRKVCVAGVATLTLSTLAHAQLNDPAPSVDPYNVWTSMVEQSSDIGSVVDTLVDSVPPGDPAYGWASLVDQVVDAVPGVDAGGSPNPPAVPEANAGLVLIPFVLAILLFSSRTAFRAKAVLRPW